MGEIMGFRARFTENGGHNLKGRLRQNFRNVDFEISDFSVKHIENSMFEVEIEVVVANSDEIPEAEKELNSVLEKMRGFLSISQTSLKL